MLEYHYLRLHLYHHLLIYKILLLALLSSLLSTSFYIFTSSIYSSYFSYSSYSTLTYSVLRAALSIYGSSLQSSQPKKITLRYRSVKFIDTTVVTLYNRLSFCVLLPLPLPNHVRVPAPDRADDRVHVHVHVPLPSRLPLHDSDNLPLICTLVNAFINARFIDIHIHICLPIHFRI